jgi:hypothetical protein
MNTARNAVPSAIRTMMLRIRIVTSSPMKGLTTQVVSVIIGAMPNNVGKIPSNDWRRQHYLDWLCTKPDHRDPPTMRELADQFGLSSQTLIRWKRDSDFIADWEVQYRKVVGDPEKAQRIMDKLFETAEDRTDPRQVQAAKAYLEAIEVLKPRKVEVTVSNKAAKDLSDEDLYAILAERAALELNERTDA